MNTDTIVNITYFISGVSFGWAVALFADLWVSRKA